MAKGIQDLGTGLGYLYKTKPDGTTIVAVEKNTADGVRSMKIAGTNNGPIIAQRPAVDGAAEGDRVTIDFEGKIDGEPFNGGKAEASFRRYVASICDTSIFKLTRLPSTSPAHARLSLEEKRSVWHAALQMALQSSVTTG